MSNLTLNCSKREDKSRDPIEKEIDDVLADNSNEFITRLVPPNEEEKEVPESANDGARTSQSQGVSISQPQAKRKRPVPVRLRKKKLRSLKSLLSDDSEKAAKILRIKQSPGFTSLGMHKSYFKAFLSYLGFRVANALTFTY